MVPAIIQPVVKLLGHTLVAAYIFPVVAMVFLTFFIMNLVEFRGWRHQAVGAFFRTRYALVNFPLDAPPKEWPWAIHHAFAEINALRDDLRRRGHFRAADTLQDEIAAIEDAVRNKVRSAQPPPLPPQHYIIGGVQIDREHRARVRESIVNANLTYRKEAIDTFDAAREKIARSLYSLRPDWLLILELPTLHRELYKKRYAEALMP